MNDDEVLEAATGSTTSNSRNTHAAGDSDQTWETVEAEEIAATLASNAREMAEEASKEGLSNPLIEQYQSEAAEYDRITTKAVEQTANESDQQNAAIGREVAELIKMATITCARGDLPEEGANVRIAIPAGVDTEQYLVSLGNKLGVSPDDRLGAEEQYRQDHNAQAIATGNPQIKLRYGQTSPTEVGWMVVVIPKS